MSQRTPDRKPTPSNRYGGQKSIPNMATPRHPEPPKRMGIGGFLFILAVMGGAVWLSMLIFGWGLYEQEGPAVTPTPFVWMTPTSTGSGQAMTEQTGQPSATPVAFVTLTPTPTLELVPYKMFGDPKTWSTALLRPDLGCEWLVIAGQVWDLQDKPVTDLVLHLYGELGGYQIDLERESGSATTYGDSGYEFALENLVVENDGTLFIQLEDADGNPISYPYALETYADCQQNLILVNFKQVR